jgi:hypothetical protein
MMIALTAALEAGARPPSQLRFAAVGGAKVAPSRAARAGTAALRASECRSL